MKIDKLDLLKKGWTTAEIEHASRIIEDAENKKHIGTKFLDKTLFRALLFLLVIINIILAIFLTPFLFLITGAFVNIIIAVTGFIFGILFTILIADIERTEKSHHRMVFITFIGSGIITLGIIIKLAQEFSTKTTLHLINNPYILGITYLVAFLVPYCIYLITEWRNRYQ